MKKFLIITILLFCTYGLSAQTTATKQYHNVLGATASTYPGMGLMYQYIFNSDYRIKFAGFYYYEKNSYTNDDNLNLGVEFQKTFHQTESTRFYGLIGFNYYYYDETYPQNYYPSDYSWYRLMGGAGFGIEFTLWEHLLLNFDIGFIYSKQTYINIDSLNYNNYNNGDKYFGIGGGAGIGYLF